MSGAPLLKVCGIRDTATAAAIAPLDIDYVGFVFAPSKRRVSPAEAGELIAAMRSSGGTQRFAGVFVNPTLDDLADTLTAAPLDVLQLHGQEGGPFVRECRERFPAVEVWKALGIGGESSHDEAAVSERLEPYAGALNALLLDAMGGGTGTTFNWNAIASYDHWAKREGIPLLIAGGLHADNVGELLGGYAADGVDVSSGVETDGVKDIEKIRTFVKRVKRA
ncbi:phosphoribosylanthranilate isomerase [Paenibacillus sp. TRM 82003]|nr:phosphoribosylanthranilate isomerase [Paenibacillus sp. TRM 82003]